MKKSYIAPALKIAIVKYRNLIATSGNEGLGLNTSVGTGGRLSRESGWDDDDEW